MNPVEFDVINLLINNPYSPPSLFSPSLSGSFEN